jgi:hypothetical protein
MLVLAGLTLSLLNNGVATARLDPILRVAQVLALLGIIGTPLVLFRAIWVWRDRLWWGTRIQAMAIALACIAFSWFLISVNVVKVSLMY